MASKQQDFDMVTFGDLAKPYDQMSDEAKQAFIKCLEKSREDQNELLRKAKEMEEHEILHTS